VIVYGFEYDYKIWYKHECILCKSIRNGKPIYASPIIIEYTEIYDILDKIKEIETKNTEKLNKIHELFTHKNHSIEPSWQIALYSKKLTFSEEYESKVDMTLCTNPVPR
jgi:hypothetical protein